MSEDCARCGEPIYSDVGWAHFYVSSLGWVHDDGSPFCDESTLSRPMIAIPASPVDVGAPDSKGAA